MSKSKFGWFIISAVNVILTVVLAVAWDLTHKEILATYIALEILGTLRAMYGELEK